MKKKRILTIQGAAGFGGGASESLVQFLNEINRSRFDIYLIIPNCQALEEGIRKKTKQNKIFIYNLTENNSIFQYCFTILKFAVFLLQNKIDLIYIVDWGVLWKPAELISAKILHIPIISHIRVPPQVLGTKSFLRLSNLIIGNSAFTLSPLKNTGLPIKVIYNFISIKQVDEGTSNFVPHKGQLKIAFVGKVRIKKGVMIYIDAAAEVLKKQKNVHFYIVGYDKGDSDGCLDKAKKTVRQKCISEYFTFTGLLLDAPQFMKHMDIIVVPSIFEEPFGRVNIEAMAARKAVIASNVGGIPEIIEQNKTGLLVPRGDVKALATAMERLIEDEQLRTKLSTNGRKIVEKRFNSKKQIIKLEKMFYENIKR